MDPIKFLVTYITKDLSQASDTCYLVKRAQQWALLPDDIKTGRSLKNFRRPLKDFEVQILDLMMVLWSPFNLCLPEPGSVFCSLYWGGGH